MSRGSVAQVIAKALVDAEFRNRLLTEPDTALSGYDLTEEERDSLSALREDAFDDFASEVEERISKSSPFDPLRHYVGVQMESGSVALDQDWNEGIAELQGASDEQVIQAELISPEDLSRLLSLSDDDD
jgi:hypothetical protein